MDRVSVRGHVLAAAQIDAYRLHVRHVEVGKERGHVLRKVASARFSSII
jgi:hypothetical protein